MKDQSCGGCAHFMSCGNDGECRRLPPVPMEHRSKWPLVSRGGWCGEWEGVASLLSEHALLCAGVAALTAIAEALQQIANPAFSVDADGSVKLYGGPAGGSMAADRLVVGGLRESGPA